MILKFANIPQKSRIKSKMSAFDTVRMLSEIILHTRLPSPPLLPPALSARSCSPPREVVRALCPARGTCLTEWSSCVPATRRPFSGHPANAARAYRSAASGDTAQGATKPAIVETGATVYVPLFVDQGDRIKIDTRTGEYLSRV